MIEYPLNLIADLPVGVHSVDLKYYEWTALGRIAEKVNEYADMPVYNVHYCAESKSVKVLIHAELKKLCYDLPSRLVFDAELINHVCEVANEDDRTFIFAVDNNRALSILRRRISQSKYADNLSFQHDPHKKVASIMPGYYGEPFIEPGIIAVSKGVREGRDTFLAQGEYIRQQVGNYNHSNGTSYSVQRVEDDLYIVSRVNVPEVEMADRIRTLFIKGVMLKDKSYIEQLKAILEDY